MKTKTIELYEYKEWKAFFDWFDNRVYNEPDKREGFVIETGKRIYKTLKQAYEDAQEESNLEELAEMNEYTFRANGERED